MRIPIRNIARIILSVLTFIPIYYLIYTFVTTSTVVAGLTSFIYGAFFIVITDRS